ncbi:MAG: hypothetical protein ACFWTY_14860 [Shouchella clausii]|jgi:hypothetical protein
MGEWDSPRSIRRADALIEQGLRAAKALRNTYFNDARSIALLHRSHILALEPKEWSVR